MEPVVADPQTWAQTHFAAANLGDRRRTQRLIHLATQIALHPSGSFPQQTESWNDLRAAYNLFDCADVTFEAIASPHWELTKKTVGERFLIIADTTEIDYGPTRQIADLASVGSGVGRGFHLHSGLMVSCDDDQVYGLAGQLIYHRQPIPKGETRTERLQRDDRESQIWAQLTTQIGSPPPGRTWIQVVDRGADDFEFFYNCQQVGHQWVARVKNLHRIILNPDGAEQTLHSYLRSLPEVGGYTLKLRARPNQPARTAKLVIAFGAMTMPTPKLKSPLLKRVKPNPIPMHVVWVREVDAPAGVEPIEWVLYTSLLVADLEDAMTVVGYYEKRWLIEEWHKALKTGLQVENRQLKTSHRLEAMMGVMSVAAVRLFQLKAEARTSPERPAADVLPPRYVTMLQAARKLSSAVVLTVGRFFRELAMMGGFLGRRHDGEPGWITIWRGWDKLQTMLRGAESIMHMNQYNEWE
jgi:hypothetical protein